MSPFRRFIGIATGTLVLQLTLLGAATPCTDASAGLDPHGMAAAEAGGHEAHAFVPAKEAATEECGEHSNSGIPSDSSSPSCIAMVSCITPMLQLGVNAQLATSVVTDDQVVPPSLEPPTRNTVPELPPPRA